MLLMAAEKVEVSSNATEAKPAEKVVARRRQLVTR